MTPSFQASKWLKLPVLLDLSEMEKLLNDLNGFLIYFCGGILKLGDEKTISHSDFLAAYGRYIETIKLGQMPDEADFRSYFSSIFTVTEDVVKAVAVSETEFIYRQMLPAVQLQMHRMDYSSHDGKYRSMVYGADSISWGIQFSYPQLFQDPQTKEVLQVGVSDLFPNTLFFREIQRWIRNHTIPTPFMAEGKKTHTPIRIGKACLTWINNHPQLAKKGLMVQL